MKHSGPGGGTEQEEAAVKQLSIPPYTGKGRKRSLPKPIHAHSHLTGPCPHLKWTSSVGGVSTVGWNVTTATPAQPNLGRRKAGSAAALQVAGMGKWL